MLEQRKIWIFIFSIGPNKFSQCKVSSKEEHILRKLYKRDFLITWTGFFSIGVLRPRNGKNLTFQEKFREKTGIKAKMQLLPKNLSSCSFLVRFFSLACLHFL
jgi:hypothetical protein